MSSSNCYWKENTLSMAMKQYQTLPSSEITSLTYWFIYDLFYPFLYVLNSYTYSLNSHPDHKFNRITFSNKFDSKIMFSWRDFICYLKINGSTGTILKNN